MCLLMRDILLDQGYPLPKDPSMYRDLVKVIHENQDQWSGQWIRFVLDDGSQVDCHKPGESHFSLDDDETLFLDCSVQIHIRA